MVIKFFRFTELQYSFFHSIYSCLFGKRKPQNHSGPIFGHKTFLTWYGNNEIYNVGMMQSSLNLQTQQNINISKLQYNISTEKTQI